MSMRVIVLLVAALALTQPAGLLAQEDPLIAPGDRVRISVDAGSDTAEYVGTIMELYSDTCVLTVEGRAEPLVVPLESVTSIQVSQGKKSAWVLGAVVGALAGLIVGAGWDLVTEDSLSYSLANEKGRRVLGGVLLGGLVGAGLTALIRIEQWETVPLENIRVEVVARRGLEVRLSASVSF